MHHSHISNLKPDVERDARLTDLHLENLACLRPSFQDTHHAHSRSVNLHVCIRAPVGGIKYLECVALDEEHELGARVEVRPATC